MSDYILSLSPFLLLNLLAILFAAIPFWRLWRTDIVPFKHYATIVFNICGVVYALFLGFVIWDVWERYYDIKKTVAEEAQQLTDLYRDSMVFPEAGEEGIQASIKKYLLYVVGTEWHREKTYQALIEGDHLIEGIWRAYYNYTPQNVVEQLWYDAALDRLNAFHNARLTRLFNIESSIGPRRWTLLLLGGALLLTIPLFFRVDSLLFRLVLNLFLANLVAFMLFIVFSLDHPFSGFEALSPYPFEYALDIAKPW